MTPKLQEGPLTSPHFLFCPDPHPGTPGSHPLTSHPILSLFCLGSSPVLPHPPRCTLTPLALLGFGWAQELEDRDRPEMSPTPRAVGSGGD